MHQEFKYYTMSDEVKNKIVSTIREVLNKENNILLAILFGSFIELKTFRDIDLAIYTLNKSLNYITELSLMLEEMIKIPIDVVPIDEVSARFRRYILTKGKVILEKYPGMYEALLIMTLDELRREELVT